MVYVIINTGQKIRGRKFSPTRSGGDIGENFLLAKISGSIVYSFLLHTYIHYHWTGRLA